MAEDKNSMEEVIKDEKSSSGVKAKKTARTQKKVQVKRKIKKTPLKKKAEKEPEPKTQPRKVSFTSEKVRIKKQSNTRWPAIFVILVLFAAVIGWAWYQAHQVGRESKEMTTGIKDEMNGEVSDLKEKLKNLTEEMEKQKSSKDEKVYKEYLNQQLGISFKYTEELGDVVEDVDEQEADEEGNVEKALFLTFSGNPDIWITGTTAGYENDEIVYYNGSEEDLSVKCPDPLAVTEDGYCDLMGVVDEQTVEIVHVPKDKDGKILNVVKTVPINLKGQEYKGLTVNVGLGTPPLSGRNLFAPSNEDDQQNALDTFLKNLIKKEGLSLVVKDNLEAYMTILTSLQVM